LSPARIGSEFARVFSPSVVREQKADLLGRGVDQLRELAEHVAGLTEHLADGDRAGSPWR
jgi:hypothetical protein